MKYVIADIHGNERRFNSIMKQINLQREDTLYVLGDVIDRHPGGIRILRRIMSMPENDLSSAQVNILILNVANCGSSTAAVQQKIHNDPIAILAELAIGFRLLQECVKFLVGVSFLHSFSCLVDF